MFRRNELQAELKRQGLTEVKYAEILGISVATLYKRYGNNGNFTREELEKSLVIFGFESLQRIFFNTESA